MAKKKFQTTMEDKKIKKIKMRAVKEGLKMNELIEKAFKEYFNKRKEDF